MTSIVENNIGHILIHAFCKLIDVVQHIIQDPIYAWVIDGESK